MHEPDLRKSLLEMSSSEWDAVLAGTPGLEHVFSPEVRAGRRARVDGKTVRRWIEQPQQHRGRLELVVVHAVRHVLRSDPGAPIHWEEVDQSSFESAVSRFLCRVAHADGVELREYSADSDVSIATPSGGIPQPQGPAQDVSESGAGGQDESTETDGSASSAQEQDQRSVDELRETASRIADALLRASERTSDGFDVADVGPAAEQWSAARRSTLLGIGLDPDEPGGFDRMTERIGEIQAQRAAQVAAERSRSEAEDRAANELQKMRSDLQQLEEMLESASDTFRPRFEQMAADLRERITAQGRPIVPGGQLPTIRESEPMPAGKFFDASSLIDDDSQVSSSAEAETGPYGIDELELAEATDADSGSKLHAPDLPSTPTVVEPSTSALGSGSQPVPAADRRKISKSEVAPSQESKLEGPREAGGFPERPTVAAQLERRASADTEHNRGEADEAVESLVAAGRFAAAYWVETAASPRSPLAEALRVAAIAFASGPHGIEPAEALVACTSSFDVGDFAKDADIAGLIAIAMARAGLAAGWMPLGEFAGALAALHLPPDAYDLLTAVEAAGRKKHRHSSVLASDVTEDPEDLRRRAQTLASELGRSSLKYQRATRLLHHLVKPGEVLGSALETVEKWADGSIGQQELLDVATQLADQREVDRQIDAADRRIANVTLKQPIIATARTQLIRSFEQVANLVWLALSGATVLDSSIEDEADRRHSEELRRLAEASSSGRDGVVGAAFEQLRRWIITPIAPTHAATALELFIRASLPMTSCIRGEEGLPEANLLDAARVQAELVGPPSPQAQFTVYAKKGNLDAAAMLAPGGSEALDDARREWAWNMKATASKLSDRLTRLPLVVRLDDVGRSAIEGRLSVIRTATTSRYDVLASELEKVTYELNRLQDEAVEQLRSELLGLNATKQQVARIEGVLATGDLTTADQFVNFVRSGDTLPSETADDLALLEEFNEGWRRRTAEVASMSFDQLCTEFGGTPDARAARGLAAWKALGSRGSELQKAVQSVLALLGLETRSLPTLESERTRLGVQTFVARDARATDGSIIPDLGSRITRYTVRVALNQLTARELVEAIPDTKRREANITLYRGRLTGKERTELITASRRTGAQVIVIDDLALAFLAQRAPGSWRATQQITLPFSSFSHYRPYIAGDVPDELFVGRQAERDEIAAADGGLFVYGGRQLGKSALLRRVQRDFDRAEGSTAIYIDLKARGIGEFNEPEHLWTVLLEELQRREIASSRLSAANRDTVPNLMRQWLQEDDDRRILLLLDEADLFLEQEATGRVEGGRRALFPNIAALKGLMDETSRRFKPVFAGLHQVQRFQNISNSPLAHGGRDMLIGPLHQAEARQLVAVPMAALGYRFEHPDLVWRLIAVTNYQAGIVQIVCAALIDHMRKKVPNAGSEPPFIISQADVETVVGSDSVRDQIAQRFQLTIRLEDRYFVIALVVATLGIADSFRDHYSAEDIREYCQSYWPEGFDTSRLTIEQLHTYLEEMVGLGVLVVRPDPATGQRYTVRSPSIVQMLGQSPEQQLTNRAQTFELPHEYNPRAARRAIGRTGSGSRSPLTEQDFATVFRDDGAAVVVIAGTAALGMTRVSDALQEVASDGTGNKHVQFTREVDQAVQRGTGPAERRPIVVLDAQHLSDADTAEAVHALFDAAQKAERDGQRRERRVVLVTASAINAVRPLVEPLVLRRWDEESLRGWNDLPFSGPEGRDQLLRATGGWPALVEEAVMARESTGEHERLQVAERYPDADGEALTFLASTGISSEELKQMRVWGSLVGVEDFDDPGGIADALGADLDSFTATLGRLIEIGVVEQSDGVAIERVVHRALQRLA